MVETWHFRSNEFAASEAFSAYHDLFSVASTSRKLDGHFSAEVFAFRYPRMLVFERILAGVSHEREQGRVARDSLDHINLHLIRSGNLLISVESSVMVAKAGQIVAFDMTRPQKTWTENAHLITVALARDAIAQKISPFADVHGRLFLEDRCGLLADFMSLLVKRGDRIEPRSASVATETMASLFATLIEDGHDRSTAPKLRETAKTDQVLAYMDRYLSDPSLGADRIASAVGVSRSVLYRLFEPLGGVATCIQQRRLKAVRRALSQLDEARPYKAIAEAYGFVSASHANRSFRQQFGMTPGEYRRKILADVEPGQGRKAPADRLNAWLPELVLDQTDQP